MLRSCTGRMHASGHCLIRYPHLHDSSPRGRVWIPLVRHKGYFLGRFGSPHVHTGNQGLHLRSRAALHLSALSSFVMVCRSCIFNSYPKP